MTVSKRQKKKKEEKRGVEAAIPTFETPMPVNTTNSVFQKLRPAVFALIAILFVVFVGRSTLAAQSGKHTVQGTVPHDADCFTQGLLYHNDKLIETCGLTGRSSVRMIDPITGNILKEIKLKPQLFAEGATIVDGLMYVLTWKNKLMLIIDVEQWQIIEEIPMSFTPSGQGWGLTDDGTDLIITDGSDKMIFVSIEVQRDSDSVFAGVKLRKKKSVTVTNPAGGKVWHINELEYVHGFVYANVWYKDYILKIDPHTAKVVSRLDFTDIYPTATRNRHADCFNGIAYNKADNTFLLTGKLWPQYHSVTIH